MVITCFQSLLLQTVLPAFLLNVSVVIYICLRSFQDLKKCPEDFFVLNLKKDVTKVNFIELLSLCGVTNINGDYNIYQVNY